MRISDWSSDVCSSDLIDYLAGAQEQLTIGVLPPSPPALPEKATVSMSEAVNQSQITFDDEKMLTDLERVMRGKIFGGRLAAILQFVNPKTFERKRERSHNVYRKSVV